MNTKSNKTKGWEFYQKCHIQKMSMCIELINKFLNPLDFQ
jgi:hypothetical protein